MKRALLFILSVLIVLNFCSCNGGSTAVTETSDAAETQPEVEKISLSLTGELNYKIIMEAV
jgi:hypothetical protein